MGTPRAVRLVAGIAAVLPSISHAGEGPTFALSAPDAESGLRGAVVSLASKTDVVFDTPVANEPRTEHEISVTLLLEADGRCPGLFVLDSRLTAAIDERESDSVRAAIAPPYRPNPASLRRDLERNLTERLFSSGAPAAAPILSVRAAGPAPSVLASVRGYADTVVATDLAVRAIGTKPLAEPLAIVPGVTLLVTRFDEDEDGLIIAYEARVDRRRGDGAPGDGLEPIFAGIGLRDPGGRLLQLVRPTQSMDTRDESIRVAEETRFTKELFRQAAVFEAIVYVGLRRIRVEFEGRNVRLAAR